ncbi:CpXC domain-containing protein [uncultured Dubosiella sp.]|uniref:CpXC domain-containing protein n=1 Tax=uncultured Dubosiella sp. TaxID=1937011 RepID=UPI0025B619F3|nr:CpXC domain-containing protein [uncultured Dubosiella sp.]
MNKRLFSMTCPYCDHPFEILKETVLIAGMDPGQEERIRNGTYFSHVCSRCGRLYALAYPFYYRKPGSYAITLVWDKPEKESPERVYSCATGEQFTKLFRILESQADWRVVFRLERLLKQKYNKSVVFESFDSNKSMYYFFVDSDLKAIHCKTKEK